MNKSVKAALLSGLLFPGTGHLLLKRYVRGIALCVTALLCLVIVVGNSIQIALAVRDRIESGEIPLDLQVITEQVLAARGGPDFQIVDFAALVLVGCWIIGIVDSYRIGRIKDRTNEKNRQS